MKELQHIVCIDDEPDILELIALSLTMVGKFKVTKYADGPTALAGLETLSADMILIDGMMSGMSGMEAYGEIRKIHQFKDVPIVFMTARLRAQEQDEYTQMGAAGIIPKPFDPMVLPQIVLSLWAEHQRNKIEQQKET